MERKKRDSIVLFVVLFVCFFAGIQLVCAILMVVFSLVDLFDGSYVDSVVAGLAGTAIIVAAGKIVSFLFLFFSFFFWVNFIFRFLNDGRFRARYDR